jgi:hypothetical protein
MAKISTYPLDSTPNLGDKLIGTDVNDNLATKNLTVGQILSVPGSATYVPYTGATANVDLGANDLDATNINATDFFGTNITLSGFAYTDSIKAIGTSLTTYDNVGQGFGLLINYFANKVRIGDYNGFYNQTEFDVDDVNQWITIGGALRVSGSVGNAGDVLVSQGPLVPPQWVNPATDTLTYGSLWFGDITNTPVETGTALQYFTTSPIGGDMVSMQSLLFASVTSINSATSLIIGKDAGLGTDGATYYGVEAGRDSSGDNNTFVGRKSGFRTSFVVGNQDENTAVGSLALSDGLYQNKNTAVGYSAGKSISGDENVAIGYNAMSQASSGIQSTAVGAKALGGSLVVGDYSTCIGHNSGFDFYGSGLTSLGINSGQSSSGLDCIFIGPSAGTGSGGNRTIGIGTDAGTGTLGSGCIFIGKEAGSGSLGDNVIAIGEESAQSQTGTAVVAIGYGAGVGNIHNFVVLLNNNAQATADSQVAITANSGGDTLILDMNGMTASRQLDIPDASGALAVSVNGIGADAQGNVDLGGFSGNIVVGVQTLTFTNGVLTSVV